MNSLLRRKFLSRVDGKVLKLSIFFLFVAFFSAVLKAEMVKNVEQLTFSRVILLGDNEMQIVQGDETTLKMFGDEDDLSPVPFKLKGDTLHLGITADGSKTSDIKYRLTVPTLESIVVKGSGEAYVKPLKTGNLLVAV